MPRGIDEATICFLFSKKSDKLHGISTFLITFAAKYAEQKITNKRPLKQLSTKEL